MRPRFRFTRFAGLAQFYCELGCLGTAHRRSACVTLENLHRRFEITVRVGHKLKVFRIPKVWVR